MRLSHAFPAFGATVLLLGAMSLQSTGCMIETDHCDTCGGGYWGGSTYEAPTGGNVVPARIDTGETLDVTPGEGVGVFIEYEPGGTWHVFATCDSARSGYSCEFNVLVSVASGVGLTSVRGDQLEAGDDIYDIRDGLELAVITSNDVDGMFFTATAGAPVQFDVYLDGVRAPKFIYWVGDGAVHMGAPSSPVDLTPSSP